jgi:hypothetical protein
MQPAAPEIERKRRIIGNRIGPSADPASSFKDREGDPCRCELCGGADSGGSRTDDGDLESVCASRKHAGAPCKLICHANLDRIRTERNNGGEVCKRRAIAVIFAPRPSPRSANQTTQQGTPKLS